MSATRFTIPSARVDDPKVDRALREIQKSIGELQTMPAASLDVLEGIQLKDGVDTTVAHGLGRQPAWVKESCIRGAAATGRVEEIRDGKFDRTRYIVLKATGFGATITIDLAVL